MLSKTQKNDIREFTKNFVLSKQIANSSFLITGATGLIGSSLIHCLINIGNGIKVIAPIRNALKAKKIFSKKELEDIQLIECNLETFNYGVLTDVDYIIHCASPTSSKSFIECPVETFDIIYNVSHALLDYAKNHPVKGLVFLSSLEVYGEIYDDSMSITENVQGYIDVMSVRSCYPMAKRSVENLCCLYAHQYGIPVKIARLTQTTGPGISQEDNRVIVQFAKFAARGQDIILHTTGESSRPYCYIMDAISAILYILLRGNNGEAYNVANDSTYISARGLAEFLRDNFAPYIDVRIVMKDNMGYAPVTKQRLSSQKLMNLGWNPRYNLSSILSNLIEYIKNSIDGNERAD